MYTGWMDAWMDGWMDGWRERERALSYPSCFRPQGPLSPLQEYLVSILHGQKDMENTGERHLGMIFFLYSAYSWKPVVPKRTGESLTLSKK